MTDLPEYQMRPGEYVEDKDVPALEEEHLQGNPIILDYEWTIIDNGSRKSTFGFDVDFMDPREGMEEYDTETYDDALSRVNSFLEAVTGRTAKQRKEDMKDAAKN